LHRKRTIEDVAKETARILKEINIEYAIVGGIAVSSWGNVRTTVDIDLVISLGDEDVERFVGAFKGRGFSVSEEDVRSALKEKTHFTIFDEYSPYHIDAKGAYQDRELDTLKTKRSVHLDDVQCFVASPEDVIANKLLFGSEQDIRDAEGVYVRQMGKLNMNALRNLCRKLGVLGQLSRLQKRMSIYTGKNGQGKKQARS